MSIEEMVALIQRQGWVRQIATPARDLPQRQRTLENVIDWSYTLLNDEEKDFFCKLGVFSGWFDTEAATTVCETDPSAALKIINALTDHSLLVREILNGKTNWRMLELIHEYAVSKLSGEQRPRVELLRANHYRDVLQRLKKDSTEQQRADFFHTTVSNLHSAVKWTISTSKTELGFQLTGFLDDYWSSYGYFKEGLELMRALFALPYDGDPVVRADRLQMASDLAWQQHDFETAIAYSKEAADLGRKHGLKGKYPAYINRLGRIYIEQGRYAEAKTALQEGLELAMQEPENMKPGVPLTQLGEIALFEDRLQEAKSLLERALSHQTDDETIFLAMARTDLAEIALAENDLPQALYWLEQAYPHASQHARRFQVFLCALAGYLVLSPDGDKQKAAQIYGAIETLSERSHVILGRFYQNLNQERMHIAREKLSEQEWLGAFESGSGWERGEAIQQAGNLLKLKRK
jgi:tetratricopeptide (TPR) repeat protein